jgi:uncharacterized membrane protein YbaN (DUF454 family)
MAGLQIHGRRDGARVATAIGRKRPRGRNLSVPDRIVTGLGMIVSTRRLDASRFPLRTKTPYTHGCHTDMAPINREAGGVWSRPFWLVVGAASLVLAVAGAILPLLPATPFLLLAGFAFARSSPRLHRWLVTHRAFGPAIENWRRYRGIGRRAKVAAMIAIVLTFLLSLALGLPGWLLSIQAVTLTAVSIFILTRPTVAPAAARGPPD